jgi:serine protease Do
VTNYHVVDHAKSVQVTADDGASYTAKVVGTDPKTDLALIKVDGKDDFPFVKFAEHAPRVGDWVIAVGNSFGLSGTVTAGIVSARGRDIGAGPYDDYVQIDAPMNKGNSGGPAFDVEGNVIGVNTSIFSPSGGSVGIGFDIPADTAKLVIAQLKDHGQVTRGWLGVQIQPVTASIAEQPWLKKTTTLRMTAKSMRPCLRPRAAQSKIKPVSGARLPNVGVLQSAAGDSGSALPCGRPERACGDRGAGQSCL